LKQGRWYKEKDLIAEKLEEHDRRLDKHDNKIGILEINDAINNTRIDNLCKSLDALISTLKWLSGFLLTAIGLLIVNFIEQLVKR
jgi:hypothetical protein